MAFHKLRIEDVKEAVCKIYPDLSIKNKDPPIEVPFYTAKNSIISLVKVSPDVVLLSKYGRNKLEIDYEAKVHEELDAIGLDIIPKFGKYIESQNRILMEKIKPGISVLERICEIDNLRNDAKKNDSQEAAENITNLKRARAQVINAAIRKIVEFQENSLDADYVTKTNLEYERNNQIKYLKRIVLDQPGMGARSRKAKKMIGDEVRGFVLNFLDLLYNEKYADDRNSAVHKDMGLHHFLKSQNGLKIIDFSTYSRDFKQCDLVRLLKNPIVKYYENIEDPEKTTLDNLQYAMMQGLILKGKFNGDTSKKRRKIIQKHIGMDKFLRYLRLFYLINIKEDIHMLGVLGSKYYTSNQLKEFTGDHPGFNTREKLQAWYQFDLNNVFDFLLDKNGRELILENDSYVIKTLKNLESLFEQAGIRRRTTKTLIELTKYIKEDNGSNGNGSSNHYNSSPS